MKAAIYARCSTLEQTVDLQLDGLREYAGARSFEVVEDHFGHNPLWLSSPCPTSQRRLSVSGSMIRSNASATSCV